MNFTTTSELARSNGVKVCTYGPTGAGKTRMIPTAPRPIIGAPERGTLSIANSGLTVALFRNSKDVDDFMMWLMSSVEARNFDTICIDSISELAEVELSDQKAKNKDPRAAYGQMQDRVSLIIRTLVNLPGKNLYMTAKSKLLKMPNGTEMTTALMPGIGTTLSLPYFFDEFFYLDTRTATGADGVNFNYNCLVTRRSPLYEAKDRSGQLAEIEQPNLTYIFDKIRAGIK